MTARRAPPLSAKLTVPRYARTLPRARLYRRLDQARAHPLTWLSGPPGAGKTTLVSGYIEARKLQAIWYRLDLDDDIPSTFFHHLSVAARRVAPRHRVPLPVPTPEHLPQLGLFSRRYFAALGARLKAPALIVLDNYQEIPGESVLHAIVAEAAVALPEGVRLLALSRGGPPRALARLRASEAVVVIENAELKFTLAEARALARLRDRRKTTPTAIGRLHGRTGGWAAGLVLLLGREDHGTVALTENVDRSVLFDYFATEIFERLDPATQGVLCQTALLPEVTATIAEALTGEPTAERVVADLYRQNYFVIKQGGREAYQFHPLFHEFLLYRGERMFASPALDALRSKAARLLDASGHVEAAAECWQAASDWEALEAHILKHAETLLGQSRLPTLEGWLRALPSRVLDRTPWLRYWFAVCRMPFDPAEARNHFEQALLGFRRTGERNGGLFSWAGIVDTALHLGRDFGALDRCIAELPDIAGSEPLPQLLNDAIVVRMFGALMLRQPDHPDIAAWSERAMSLLQSNGDASLRLSAGVHLGIYFVWIGDARRARLALDWLLTLARAPDLPPLMRLLVRATEGLVAWLLDADATRCLRIVEEALAEGERTGVHVWDHHLIGHGAAAALSNGDMVSARRLLSRLAADLGQSRLLDIGYYHFLCHWEALLRGDLAEAAVHSNAVEVLRGPLGFTFGNTLFHMMAANLHLEQSRFNDARKSLRDVRKIGERTDSRLVDYMVSLGEADLARRDGDEEGMRERLEHAFSVGRERDLITCHGWRAEPMAELCARALEAGIETRYVTELIRRRALEPPRSARSLAAWPWPIKLRTLGGFAVEVSGKALPSAGKLARKPLGLLKLLVSAGPLGLSSAQATEALWPDLEAQHSYQAYSMALHRLRELLGLDESVLSQDGRVRLNPRHVFVDAWAFEWSLDTAAADGEAGLERAVELYGGMFLGEGGADDHWALAYGERLYSRYLRAALRLGRAWQDKRDFERAIDLYQDALEHDDLQESLHQRLIDCFCATGRRADGLRAYERCRRRLKDALGVAPSARTEALKVELLKTA